MSINFSEEAVNLAVQTLSQRKTEAEEEQQRREFYVYSQLPEVSAMKRRISDRYFNIIRLVADHNNNAAESAEKLRSEIQEDQQRIRVLLTDLTGDPDYLDTPYTCPKCGDTGYFEGKRCECMTTLLKQYAVDELNRNSSITLRSFDEYVDSCYDSDKLKNHMNSMKRFFVDYCRNFPNNCRSLYMTGRTGLGKTFFSSCIATELAGRGFAVAIGSVSDLLRKLENEQFGRSDGNTMELLLEADMLIIDDLGTEFKSQFNESALYAILNGRINKKKLTIISTNLNAEQLNERYNERIASRILGGFMPIIFSGSDLRQKIL